MARKARQNPEYELPDVERDFFISPSAPEELQDFVVELLWYLYSEDRGGKIDEYAQWDQGNCWTLAQALHEWIGPRSSLVWVVGKDLHKEDRFRDRPPMVQHVVCKVGDFYIDSNGVYTEPELIEWFVQDDFVRVSLKPFDVDEAEAASIHCRLRDKRMLLRDLDLEFGDGQDVADAADAP